MKRLVWLLLAVWCTALAQVRPVEPLRTAAHGDCCCDCDGTCGMPDCAPPPAAPATSLTVAERPATVARPQARRSAQATAELLEKFYASFAAPAVAPMVAPASAPAALPARVPLFREHCALLI